MSLKNKNKLIESLLREDKFYKPITSKFSSIKPKTKKISEFDSNDFKSSFKKMNDYFKSNESKVLSVKKTYKIYNKVENKLNSYGTLNEFGKSILNYLDQGYTLSIATLGILYGGLLSNKSVWFQEKITLDNVKIDSIYFSDIDELLKSLMVKLKDLDFYIYEIELIAKKSKESKITNSESKIYDILKKWDSTAWASDDSRKYQEQLSREEEIKSLFKILDKDSQKEIEYLLKTKYDFNV